jgi:DNA-binding GntR family transcriptional regulator
MNANEEEFLPYDDDEAIKFIRNQIPQELKEKFSDDDLNYLIDLIYEFYEEKGFLDDDDTEVDIDLDELTAYVVKQAKKDKVGVYTEEEISFVVDAEIAYCDSLGVFE